MNDIDINTALNQLAVKVHDNAVEHGWWDTEVRPFGEIIALCHSELSEALESYRSNEPMVWFEKDGQRETNLSLWQGEKLEGIATEMADCIIRILDWCGKEEVDIGNVLMMKHEYNKNRPYRHCGKRI